VVKFAQTVDELLTAQSDQDPTGESPDSWVNEAEDAPGEGEPGGEEA